jgi:prevent-host-death family protein
MPSFEMHDAKTALPQLVERAQAGEEIVIARNGTPVARLVPIRQARSLASVRGGLKGQIEFAPDFGEVPDDLADAFGAR